MKKYILSFVMLLMLSAPAHALTVTCTNCSNSLVQLLDRITNMEELNNAIAQYGELIVQTEQQIRMVQQNIEQYQNMLQNTMQLPANLIGEVQSAFTRLASLTGQLKTLRGDVVALGEIFTNLFPEQSLFKGLAGSSPANMADAIDRYRLEWDKWAKRVDTATQATFQLSGSQLADLQQDSARFQAYLNELLSTPDGQQKAIMAGNQLSTIQIQEVRQLRELVATQVQSSIATQMKSEKESQMTEEAWRDTTKTDRIGNKKAKADPF